MRYSKKLLLASVAGMALITMPAHAETVTKKTVVQQKELPEMNKTNFSAFDLNDDQVLSMQEVGEKLFYIFDTDGNEVIDNIEFDHKQVMTVIPMEKDTYTFVDWDNDGEAEQSTYTRENFFEVSGLMRFDKNMDGLTAEEFIGKTMLELDIDKSKVIELDEWESAYEESVRPANAEQERYN